MNSSEIRRATITGYLSHKKNNGNNGGWSDWITTSGFTPHTDQDGVEYLFKNDGESSVYLKHYPEYGLWVAEDRSRPDVYSAEALSRVMYDSRGFGIGLNPMSAIEDLNDDQEKLIFDLIESSVHTAVSLLHRLVKSGDGLQEVKDMEEKMRECLRESQSIGFGEMKRWWED